MIDLAKYRDFEELINYYNEIKEEYEDLKEVVDEIDNFIVANPSYLLEVSQEFIENVKMTIPSIFKQNDLINYERYRYVDYLIEEFHNSEIYITYLYMTYEVDQIGIILSAMYKNDNLPEETVNKINEFIFEEYKLLRK